MELVMFPVSARQFGLKDMLEGHAGVEDFWGGIVWEVIRVVLGLLCHFDRQMLFPLCFPSTRDHS